jgi:hypothetical protein
MARTPTRNTYFGAAVCIAAITGLGAGSAQAGEVTGNGKSLKPLNARSACAFSGLEDWAAEGEQPEGEIFVQPGVTQTWGQIPKQIRDFIATIGFHPGDACNPNVGEPTG